MSRRSRIVLGIVVGGLFLAMAVGVAYTAASIFRSGSIAIGIAERDGTYVFLRVPAAVLRLGLLFLPEEALREAGREWKPLWPGLRKAIRELSRSPDGPLLNLNGPDCDVTLGKRENLLILHAESRDASVHVAVPLDSLDFILKKLEGSMRDIPTLPKLTDGVRASLPGGPRPARFLPPSAARS